jgi:hypothetical protein
MFRSVQPARHSPYNFNLAGCGGLLAPNRSMDVEALCSGLKNRTLDSILFPGGWRSISTMKRSYQLADEAGVLEAVLESRKLRDHGA